jgi:hypothetical protein
MINKRIAFVIGGIISCTIGFDIWAKYGGVLYHQPVPRISGIVLVCFGLVMIITGLFRPHSFKETKYICRKCEKITTTSKIRETNCPDCNTRMEPLEGFYERHPDKY